MGKAGILGLPQLFEGVGAEGMKLVGLEPTFSSSVSVYAKKLFFLFYFSVFCLLYF